MMMLSNILTTFFILYSIILLCKATTLPVLYVTRSMCVYNEELFSDSTTCLNSFNLACTNNALNKENYNQYLQKWKECINLSRYYKLSYYTQNINQTFGLVEKWLTAIFIDGYNGQCNILFNYVNEYVFPLMQVHSSLNNNPGYLIPSMDIYQEVTDDFGYCGRLTDITQTQCSIIYEKFFHCLNGTSSFLSFSKQLNLYDNLLTTKNIQPSIDILPTCCFQSGVSCVVNNDEIQIIYEKMYQMETQNLFCSILKKTIDNNKPISSVLYYIIFFIHVAVFVVLLIVVMVRLYQLKRRNIIKKNN